MKRTEAERNINKAVSDQEVVVNDFVRRAPFWSYKTVNYGEFAPFAALQKEADAYLEKLFLGELDDGNGDVLDNIIMRRAQQAKKDLQKQRTEHRSMINSLYLRAVGDRGAFEKELAGRKEELARVEKQQKRYEELVEKDEFIRRAEK